MTGPGYETYQQDALKEAAAFELPLKWEEGREGVPGITIDSERTLDRDDAIWLEKRDGEYQLHVRISDVGSFLSPMSALARLAESRGETRYLRTSNIPMLPAALSDDKLSLLDTKETPVVSVALSYDDAFDVTDVQISRDRVKPYRLTYRDVNRLTHSRESSTEADALRTYEQFALTLIWRRRAAGAFAYYDEQKGLMTNADGVLVQMRGGVRHAGELIVQESAIAANTAMAEYMWRNNIPGLFRNHHMRLELNMDQAVEIMQSGSEEGLAMLRQSFGRATFGVEPEGHDALNLDAYMPWTSPLRRFADFASHMNLVAHLEGREYPYSFDRLEGIAAHLNALRENMREERSAAFKAIDHAATAQRLGKSTMDLLNLSPDGLYKVIKMAAQTGVMTDALQSAIADRATEQRLMPREIAQLLLSKNSSIEAWEPVVNSVFTYLLSMPQDAPSTLHLAVQNRLVDSFVFTTGPAQKGFSSRAAVTFGEDGVAVGTAIAFSKKIAEQQAAIDALAKITGYELPDGWRRHKPDSPAGTDTSNSKGYLQEFMQKAGLSLPTYATEVVQSDGTNHIFEAIVSGRIDGEPFSFPGRGSTKKAAQVEAAAKAVEELGLTESNLVWRTQTPTPDRNFIGELQERSQSLRIKLPEYSFREFGANHIPGMECTVTILNDEGKKVSFAATGPNKQAAKANAAKRALESIV